MALKEEGGSGADLVAVEDGTVADQDAQWRGLGDRQVQELGDAWLDEIVGAPTIDEHH